MTLPSLLAFYSWQGVPMLVYVRPSNEALLRARVPGAQDQHGDPLPIFYRARFASKEGSWSLPPPIIPRLLLPFAGWLG